MQLFMTNTQPGRHAGPEIVHKNIRRTNQHHQSGQILRIFQIQHHAEFTAIHAQKRTAFGFKRRGVFAQIVACRGLDFDYLGALVSQ